MICYNPFRPYLNRRKGPRGSGHLADRGFQAVINQVFRTLLHTRLALGLRAYMHDEGFHGDIVVIEPRETDEQFFDMGPLAFWKRSDAVRHGFDSVRRTLLDHMDVLQPIFARYGLELREPCESDAAAGSVGGQATASEAPLADSLEDTGAGVRLVREA